MKRKVYFRADGNDIIGRGHISRCVAIADMIYSDFDIFFLVLSENESFFLSLKIDYNHLIINDDTEVLSVINETDILWLDGYHFLEEFKASAKSKSHKLIETNDIPYSVNNVDILVNHTPKISKTEFVSNNNSVQLLLGLKYVLLRKNFLKLAQNYTKNSNKGAGVFICFGGADTYNLGLKFVINLLNYGFEDPIYWVTKSEEESNKHSFNENVHLLNGLNETQMIHYMSSSKAILIPSSVLSFEAMAIRKPIFTGYFVDNQKLIYKGLLEQGLADGTGYLETNDQVAFATQSFLSFYSNEKKHLAQIENQEKAIDGHSGERIKNTILE